MMIERLDSDHVTRRPQATRQRLCHRRIREGAGRADEGVKLLDNAEPRGSFCRHHPDIAARPRQLFLLSQTVISDRQTFIITYLPSVHGYHLATVTNDTESPINASLTPMTPICETLPFARLTR